MENRGPLAIAFGFALVATFVFGATAWRTHAYAGATHMGLTTAIIAEYEAHRGDVFSDEEARALTQGSYDEDGAQRFLNHFYDPVTEEGIAGNLSLVTWSDDILEQAHWGVMKGLLRRIGGGGGLPPHKSLFSAENDHTWQRAVYEYAHGDTVRGMYALGHVLHLLQDAAVPAHVRNDAHPNFLGFGDRDPYEHFTRRVSAEAARPHIMGVQARRVGSIHEALRETAVFTQENFLSKDTLFKNYSLPRREGLELERIKSKGDDQYFGVGAQGKIVRIRIWRDKEQKGAPKQEEYFITDENNTIFTENWQVLSRHAAAYSMGVLDLFFEEVARERETERLLAMNKSRNDTQRVINALANVRDMRTRLTSLAASDVYELNERDLAGYFDAAAAYGIHVPAIARNSPLKNEERVREQPAATPEPEVMSGQSIIGTPIADLGGAVPPRPTENTEASQEQHFDEATTREESPMTQEVAPSEAAPEGEGSDSLTATTTVRIIPIPPRTGGATAPRREIILPAAPVVTVPAEDARTFSTTTVDFAGTADVGVTVSLTSGDLSVATGTNASGEWSLPGIFLGEDTTAITLVATDADGNTSETTTIAVTIALATDAPVLTNPQVTTIATSTVTFEGEGIAGNILSAVIGTSTATTTVHANGMWALPTMILREKETELSLRQTDPVTGRTSKTNTLTITVDTTAPTATTLTVLECAYTLRNDGECLVATNTVQLQWEDVHDADHYAVTVDGVHVSTTTATSTAVTLADQATSSIAVAALDRAGNSAISTTVVVEAFSNPVVITEVAWGGTHASAEDEWFELYNRTPYTLSLADVALRRSDMATSAALTGTIGAGDFWYRHAYLIERGREEVTSKTANAIISWDPLPDTGAQLTLVHATGTLDVTLDATPEVEACSGWCAGTNTGKFLSMERKSVDGAGTDSGNWQSNDGYKVTNEYHDANNLYKIFGTVLQESSKNYPEFGYFCDPYTESFIEGGTYSPPVPQEIGKQNCTYMAGLWGSGRRIPPRLRMLGGLYRGSVGSSTQLASHSIGGIQTRQNGNISSNLSAGDALFVAMYKLNSMSSAERRSEGMQFRDYFTGAATATPPHGDFRVLNWVFGG